MNKILSFTKILMISLFVWSLQLSILTASIPVLPSDLPGGSRSSEFLEINAISVSGFACYWDIQFDNIANPSHPYHYEYLFASFNQIDNVDIVSIEVSEDFSLSNIENVIVSGISSTDYWHLEVNHFLTFENPAPYLGIV